MLQDYLSNDWPDPQKENFQQEYAVRYGKAKFIQWLINVLSTTEDRTKSIQKAMEADNKQFQTGAGTRAKTKKS